MFLVLTVVSSCELVVWRLLRKVLEKMDGCSCFVGT